MLRHPRRQLAEARERVVLQGTELRRAWDRDLQRRRAAVEGARGRLEALSPVAVLGRGYAVALHEGRAVRDAAALHPGARIQVRLHTGQVGAVVDAVEEAQSKTRP